MLKLKIKSYKIIHVRALASVIVVAAVLSGATFYAGIATADRFDEQINALQNKNAANQRAVNQLGAEADSYEDAINKLQQQINALQQAIIANQRASAKLESEIKAKKAELAQQRKVLGQNIKAMYLEGEISTLEILAASRDISEFVNREVARTAVQNKIKDTVDQITKLKLQLEQKQRELKSRIRDQQNQQAELNANQAKQAQLLAYTEGQKTAYEQSIRKNSSQIASLRAQQLAANRALGGRVVAGDPNRGGYPAYLARASKDALVDPWGMYNRECVSYTAWKVYSIYGNMPYWGGHGNANEWPGSARADGIPTGSQPKVGAVAVSMSGFYGHTMWVEAVNGNMIYVSQYNYDLRGSYSEMWVNGSNFIYIYFR